MKPDIRYALPIVLGVLAAPVTAQDASGSVPARIDAAVAQFTGQPIGTAGGARQPVDRRLQLAACGSPFMLDWYGTPGRTVKVECPDGRGWRVFVNLVPQPQAPGAQATRPVIKRGDSILLVVKGHGFTIQRQGEAAEAGSVGDWIEVRTSREAQPVRARIEQGGVAVLAVN